MYLPFQCVPFQFFCEHFITLEYFRDGQLILSFEVSYSTWDLAVLLTNNKTKKQQQQNCFEQSMRSVIHFEGNTYTYHIRTYLFHHETDVNFGISMACQIFLK